MTELLRKILDGEWTKGYSHGFEDAQNWYINKTKNDKELLKKDIVLTREKNENTQYDIDVILKLIDERLG